MRSRPEPTPVATAPFQSTKTIEWRIACRDELKRLFVGDEKLGRHAYMRTLRQVAMADARRHYGTDRLAAGQVMSWPDVLAPTVDGKRPSAAALERHREQYHKRILTPAHHQEIEKRHALLVRYRDDLIQRAFEDGGAKKSYDELVDWVMNKPGLLAELGHDDVVPKQP